MKSRVSAVALGISAALVVGTIVIPGISQAADGRGVYGTWSLDAQTPTTAGSVAFSGTTFPSATFTSTDAVLAVARSATMSGTTPFGLQYGTSSGSTYLTSAIASGKPEGTLTLTFRTPPVPGTYGLAVGDVDAETLVISATGPDGSRLNVAEWGVDTFNTSGSGDAPTWVPGTGRIEGNGTDTTGATAWISPSQAVATLTITQVRTAGFPTYQLWIAADVLAATPVPSPTATTVTIPPAPPGKVVICHRTGSRANPYIEATVSQDSVTRANGHATHTGPLFPADGWGDIIPPFPGFAGINWPAGAAILANGCETGGESLLADRPSATPTAVPTADTICTTADTRLENGDFERPVIPARSFRQIVDTDVPGWFTTASDRKIEIWSTGYQGVTAPEGNQFAEINATQPGELYQVVDTIPGQSLVWSLAHRARASGARGDTMSVNIGPATGAANQTTTFTDVLTDGWVRHTGTYVVPAGQTQTRFGFASGPTASNSPSIGNFLDDIFFTTTECFALETPVPLPTPTASPSTSSSPLASPTATPTASPTASVSATATPTGTATATPTSSPTPTATQPTTPSRPTNIVVDPTSGEVPTVPPDRPTVITIDGGTITDIGDPTGGTAVVDGGTIIFRPDDPGRVTIPVTYVTDDGTETRTVIRITVGEPQTASITSPTRLVLGRNVLLPTRVLTSAGQQVTVSVACAPLDRVASGDLRLCTLRTEGGRVVLDISAPARVRVTYSAPPRGGQAAFEQVQRYLVR